MRTPALILACLLAAPAAGFTQSTPLPAAPVPLESVTVGAGPTVVITAAGPLQVPRVGVLRAPDRIYVDLPGVSSRTFSASGDGRIVSTVRVAQHSLEPLVTRIVVDLQRPSRYSLDTSGLDNGRVTVLLSSDAARSPSPRAPASATPRPPARPTPTAPSRVPDPATRRYLASVQPALDGLAALREVLADIDRRTNAPADRLQTARSELAGLRRVVASVKPPAKIGEAHDLLNSVVGFASTALDLPTDESGAVAPNASSAAAGALLMLQRAEAELGVQRKSL